MRIQALPYLRKLRGIRSLGWAALIVYAALLSASVVHPLVHDHPGHADECLIEQCLSIPQITPEVFTVDAGLAVVERFEIPAELTTSHTVREAALSRGPPFHLA